MIANIVKTLLSLLKKIILWGLVLALVTVAAIFIVVAASFTVNINSRDENLSAQAVALLSAPPNPYHATQNIYVMLAGLDVPSGRSIVGAGQARIHTYETELERDPAAFYRSQSPPIRGALLAVKGAAPCCQGSAGELWHAVDGHGLQIRRWLAANRELYRRYRELHTAAGYYDTATPSPTHPLFFPSARLRQLFLAYCVLRMKSADPAARSAALTAMADDFQVWHKVLMGYGSIEAKMGAIIYIKQDLLVIGDMIADPKISLSAGRGAIRELVTPFPLKDWRIGNAFAYNFRLAAGNFKYTHETARRVKEPLSANQRRINGVALRFFKLHATDNLEARYYRKVIAIVDGPPRALAESRSGQVGKRNCLSTPRIGCLYNPVGRILVAVGALNYRQYALWAYDVAALQRMVRLAYAVRVRKIPLRQIVPFMERHPQWSTHPVNGNAFAFDLRKRRLSVERLGYAARGKNYFSIPVWPQPAAKTRRSYPNRAETARR